MQIYDLHKFIKAMLLQMYIVKWYSFVGALHYLIMRTYLKVLDMGLCVFSLSNSLVIIVKMHVRGLLILLSSSNRKYESSTAVYMVCYGTASDLQPLFAHPHL